MSRDEYWESCIEASCSDHGIPLTIEQIRLIAGDCAGAHECYGMAHYQPESPYPSEIKRLERELKIEREKVPCKVCNGTGTTHNYGGTMMSTSQCYKCRGDGRHSP